MNSKDLAQKWKAAKRQRKTTVIAADVATERKREREGKELQDEHCVILYTNELSMRQLDYPQFFRAFSPCPTVHQKVLEFNLRRLFIRCACICLAAAANGT
eukprot:COSAG02_NODE_5081_length_4657_cov_2.861562_2_plen_101_part_00